MLGVELSEAIIVYAVTQTYIVRLTFLFFFSSFSHIKYEGKYYVMLYHGICNIIDITSLYKQHCQIHLQITFSL